MHSSMVLSLGEANKSELILKKNLSQTRKESRRININSNRMQELKLLLMLGFIKKVKTAYLFNLDSQQIVFASNDENLLSTTYQSMSEFQKKIRTKMVLMKRKEKHDKFSKISDKQNSLGSKNSYFSVTLPFGRKEKDKIKNQIYHFQKLILIIDRKDKNSCVKQNHQNLSILMGNVNRVKTLIYRHYKTIQLKNQEHQIMTIKNYCSSTFIQFKTLISLLQNNVQKNKNYHKYMRYLKVYEPKIDVFNCKIQLCLQALLFYISSVIQLKRFYQLSTKIQQIANKISLQTINNITQHTIKLRHYLGYLAKIIADPIVSKKEITKYEPIIQAKDLWRHIYQRKYIPTLCSKSLKNQ